MRHTRAVAMLTEHDYAITSLVKEDDKVVFVQKYTKKSIVDYQLAKKLTTILPVPVDVAATRLKLSLIEDVHGIRPTVEKIVADHPLEFKLVSDGKKTMVVNAR